jgi:hypothetical protein
LRPSCRSGPASTTDQASCAAVGSDQQSPSRAVHCSSACRATSAVSGRRGASNTCGCPISARPAEPAWGPLNERFQCFSAFERAERGKGSPSGRSPPSTELRTQTYWRGTPFMCCRFSARSQAHSKIFFVGFRHCSRRRIQRQRNTGTVAGVIHPVGRRFPGSQRSPGSGKSIMSHVARL